MDYAIEERIGNPDLFTGRKEELSYFLKWINNIKERKSQSTAILARRKMGKTAILERLFNITFYKNNGVIPFYYEIKETDMWLRDFCQEFFLTFIYQYIAFKTRKLEYIKPENMSDFGKAAEIAKDEGLDYLCGIIEGTAHAYDHDKIDILWEIVRQAPQTIAYRRKEFIVQMIDEFQFMNSMIYWDKRKKNPIKNLAGGYLSTAESKIAPLLVSGSWVGWLMDILVMNLPARFIYYFLENMTTDEAVEMVYKYSQFFEIPVTEETAYLVAEMAEGSPFYIGSIFRSVYKRKDLRTANGLSEVLEFETLNNQGIIKATWMEYVEKAFYKINDRNAKRIVLHLFKHKGRELTRKDLQEELNLEMTDKELEKKMDALVKGDIINQGQTHFDFRCVEDNIFDKVFRGVYQKEIEQFDVGDIKKEYARKIESFEKQYRELQGKYSYHMGYFAEYLILEKLRVQARERNEFFKSITCYLPGDFDFCEYARVWRYDITPEYSRRFNVDIFARAAAPGDYSIIGEVKSREARKFSKEEAVEFERKFAAVKAHEKLDRALGFIFSRSGFSREAEDYCREKGLACSSDQGWLA